MKVFLTFTEIKDITIRARPNSILFRIGNDCITQKSIRFIGSITGYKFVSLMRAIPTIATI